MEPHTPTVLAHGVKWFGRTKDNWPKCPECNEIIFKGTITKQKIIKDSETPRIRWALNVKCPACQATLLWTKDEDTKIPVINDNERV